MEIESVTVQLHEEVKQLRGRFRSLSPHPTTRTAPRLTAGDTGMTLSIAIKKRIESTARTEIDQQTIIATMTDWLLKEHPQLAGYELKFTWIVGPPGTATASIVSLGVDGLLITTE